MLALLQIINHMIVGLEYTENEVEAAFKSIQDGAMSLQDLLDSLNLELSPTNYMLAQTKIRRWPSALHVIKIREGLA